MKVIGLTDELRGAAERHCAEEFRAWLGEAKRGTWSDWDELEKHFPQVRRMDGDEARFPLTIHGAGIDADVFFKLQLLMLRCIVPAPIASPASQRQPLSLPPSTLQKQAITP